MGWGNCLIFFCLFLAATPIKKKFSYFLMGYKAPCSKTRRQLWSVLHKRRPFMEYGPQMAGKLISAEFEIRS